MFKQSVISASLVAGVLAGPLAVRNGHISSGSHIISSGSSHDLGSFITPVVEFDGQSFDSHSISVTEFSSHHSFNNFGGLSSLSGFDDFFGNDDFCGSNNVQVFDVSRVETCHPTVHVNVIQQQLSILGEYAKRLILTQSCETEAQVLLFSQWLSSLTVFNNDLRRQSSREVTFDSNIASHINNLCDSSLVINSNPFEFSGSDIGSSSVHIIGGNWNSQFSPSSVSLTWSSCQSAAGFQNIPLVGNCVGSSCPGGLSLPPFVEQQCSLATCQGTFDSGSSSIFPPSVSSGSSVFPPSVSSGSSIGSCPEGLDCSGGSPFPPEGVSSGSSLPPSEFPPSVSSGSSELPPSVSSGSSILGGSGEGVIPSAGEGLNGISTDIPLLTASPAGARRS
jgi:hypothetical protein